MSVRMPAATVPFNPLTCSLPAGDTDNGECATSKNIITTKLT